MRSAGARAHARSRCSRRRTGHPTAAPPGWTVSSGRSGARMRAQTGSRMRAAPPRGAQIRFVRRTQVRREAVLDDDLRAVTGDACRRADDPERCALLDRTVEDASGPTSRLGVDEQPPAARDEREPEAPPTASADAAERSPHPVEEPCDVPRRSPCRRSGRRPRRCRRASSRPGAGCPSRTRTTAGAARPGVPAGPPRLGPRCRRPSARRRTADRSRAIDSVLWTPNSTEGMLGRGSPAW